ncbi:MAG: DUF2087 domain-containing protein [Oscillospiraceae bacterium]|nr:DUF2087 domain-containing protein [Oscillospiraceae bacterium]
MDRDYGREIDALKEMISEMAGCLRDTRAAGLGGAPEAGGDKGHITKMPGMHPDPAVMGVLSRLEDSCARGGDIGRVTHMGVFSSGGRQSTWVRDDISADGLIGLITDRTAEKVLACIGSGERLGILLELLRQPLTVAGLVERRGLKSTGQAYHHLKPLLTADVIHEDRNSPKGTYAVQPHRVEGIIMLLAGIKDMVDTEHSSGEWGAEIHGGARMVDERYMATAEEERKALDACFSSAEPLVLRELPSKQKRKLIVLKTVAGQFERGRRYSEKEVNKVLKPIYEDHTTIRRYLIEYGFMDRTPDGSAYWLT